MNIPPAALEAGARASHNEWRHACADETGEPVEYWQKWSDLELAVRISWIEQTRAAFLAMIEAWEGAAVCHYTIGDDEGYEMVLPLPFPQEASDE